MNCLKFTLLLGVLLLLLSIDTSVEAKKRRKSSTANGNKSKTKTKWSTSTELGAGGISPLVTSEEHGYYVKRTYLPTTNTNGSNSETEIVTLPARQSPPYLAIPIAWFKCEDKTACQQGNTLALNSELQALSAGFLCDDDCFEPFEPICGKTNFEVAVFYNKCKLNVAKCRTHGLWQDYIYEECQAKYPKEIAYAEQKFRASPYFKEAEKPLAPEVEKEAIVNIALEALSEIDYKIAEAEAEQKIVQNTPKELEKTKEQDKMLKKENETEKLITI